MPNPSKKCHGLYALAALLLCAAMAAAMVWYYDVYVHWQPNVFPVAVIALSLGIAALTLLALWVRGGRKPLRLLWKTLLSAVVFTGVILAGVTFSVNKLLRHSVKQSAAYKRGYEDAEGNQRLHDGLVDALARGGVPLIQDIPPEPFALGEFKITVFNGAYDGNPYDENANSMGVLVEAFGLRAFLAGDLNNYAGAVIITAGPGGGNARVLRRYAKYGATQLCTGDFGGVVSVFGGSGMKHYAIGG